MLFCCHHSWSASFLIWVRLVTLACGLSMATQNRVTAQVSQAHFLGEAVAADRTLLLTPGDVQVETAATESRIKSLEATIESLDKDDDANRAAGWLAKSFAAELAQLKYLHLVYQQHAELLETQRAANSQHHDVEDELQRLYDRIVENGDHASFSEIEGLRSAVDDQEKRVAKITAEIESGNAARLSSKQRLTETDRNRRRIREQLELTDDSTESRKLSRSLMITQLSARINKLVIANAVLQNENRRIGKDVGERRLVMLKKILSAMPTDLELTTEELNRQVRRLKERQIAIQRKLVESSERFGDLELKLKNASEKEQLDPVARTEIMATFEQLREIFRLRATYLNTTLTELFELQHLWSTRHELAHGKLSEEEAVLRHEAFANLSVRLRNDRKLVEMHLGEARSVRATLQTRLSDDSSDTLRPRDRWLRIHVETLDDFFSRTSTNG